jgi:hypothetical protein
MMMIRVFSKYSVKRVPTSTHTHTHTQNREERREKKRGEEREREPHCKSHHNTQNRVVFTSLKGGLFLVVPRY